MINHVYDIPDKLLIKNGKSPKQIRRSKHGKSISNFAFWMFICHDLITGHYDKNMRMMIMLKKIVDHY